MTYNYKADRMRLEAILDERNRQHGILPLPDLGAASIIHRVPNPVMAGFGCLREAYKAIREDEFVCTIDS